MPDFAQKTSLGFSIAVLSLFSAFLAFYGIQYVSWENQINVWIEQRVQDQERIEKLETKVDALQLANNLCEVKTLEFQYRFANCQNDNTIKIMERSE